MWVLFLLNLRQESDFVSVWIFQTFRHFCLFEMRVLVLLLMVGFSPLFLCVCVILLVLEELEQRVELRSHDISELVLCL